MRAIVRAKRDELPHTKHHQPKTKHHVERNIGEDDDVFFEEDIGVEHEDRPQLNLLLVAEEKDQQAHSHHNEEDTKDNVPCVGLGAK